LKGGSKNAFNTKVALATDKNLYERQSVADEGNSKIFGTHNEQTTHLRHNRMKCGENIFRTKKSVEALVW
jgi:hypothetical protein